MCFQLTFRDTKNCMLHSMSIKRNSSNGKKDMPSLPAAKLHKRNFEKYFLNEPKSVLITSLVWWRTFSLTWKRPSINILEGIIDSLLLKHINNNYVCQNEQTTRSVKKAQGGTWEVQGGTWEGLRWNMGRFKVEHGNIGVKWVKFYFQSRIIARDS